MLLLANQQQILSERLEQQANPHFAGQLPEKIQLDSFYHFLPFSDSTFIVSREPNKFLRQFADFLAACFQINEHAYLVPEIDNAPEEVTIREWGLSGVKTFKQRWYPGLWRGGLAFGDVHLTAATAITDGSPYKVPNIVGPAVVDAVRVEKNGKGPRLFCARELPDSLDIELKAYFAAVEGSETVSEFLWPALTYAKENPHVEINDFCNLWLPAVALWKSKRGQPSFVHYDEFLKLLIRSVMCWAGLIGYTSEAKDYVRSRIQRDLGDDLVDAYLS